MFAGQRITRLSARWTHRVQSSPASDWVVLHSCRNCQRSRRIVRCRICEKGENRRREISFVVWWPLTRRVWEATIRCGLLLQKGSGALQPSIENTPCNRTTPINRFRRPSFLPSVAQDSTVWMDIYFLLNSLPAFFVSHRSPQPLPF